MACFGITVKAKDAVGEHYVNHTVYAPDLDSADQLIVRYYQDSDEILIEFDQAVQLDDIHAEGASRILETMGKIYFDEMPSIESNVSQKVFEIQFEGTGYNLLAEDNQKIGGFFVSVLASAQEPEQAFEIAYQKLISSQAYQELVAAHEHPNAVMSVHQYCEIIHVDLNISEISAFVFYPPDDQIEDGSVTKH